MVILCAANSFSVTSISPSISGSSLSSWSAANLENSSRISIFLSRIACVAASSSLFCSEMSLFILSKASCSSNSISSSFFSANKTEPATLPSSKIAIAFLVSIIFASSTKIRLSVSTTSASAVFDSLSCVIYSPTASAAPLNPSAIFIIAGANRTPITSPASPIAFCIWTIEPSIVSVCAFACPPNILARLPVNDSSLSVDPAAPSTATP